MKKKKVITPRKNASLIISHEGDSKSVDFAKEEQSGQINPIQIKKTIKI